MFDLYSIVIDCNDKPVLAVIQINNNEVNEWNKDCPAQIKDSGLRGAAPSTRGPEWTNLWCTGCHASGIAG